jgi:hypothetical protein
MVYGTWHIVHHSNVHARVAGQFGAACTECGKGYTENKKMKKKKAMIFVRPVPIAERE